MLNFIRNLNNSIIIFIKQLCFLNIKRFNYNSLFSFIVNHIIYYPTPVNLTYNWSFGFLAVICLFIQILSGIFLAMHYVPHIDLAFSSIEYIMRDVSNGWFIRYVHVNGASMFFIIVYCHIFRGLYYGSYMKPRESLWCSGVFLIILMMTIAFTGYILPWGQMSFWGATVITSMFTAFPVIGKSIVEWLWGGFTIDNPTLNRFYSIHYFLPFVIMSLTFIHLILLHKDGSNNPMGFDSNIDDISFAPYFILKDLFIFFCFLFLFGSFIFYFPNILNHPDNSIPADSIKTPIHVVPEWYFLPFYAILRSIPNKSGGIFIMLGAILVLLLIPFNNISEIRSTRYWPIFKICYWILIGCLVLLKWIGQCPLTDIYIYVGQICTIYYYIFFILILPIIGRVELVLMHYNKNK